MTASAGERWWRRIHQLPGIEVCAVHGKVLLDSKVDARLGRSQVYQIPDGEACQVPATSLEAPNIRAPAKFHELAVAASALLTTPPPPRENLQLRQDLAERLRARGLTRGPRFVCQKAVRALLRDYWGGVMDVVPGLELELPSEVDWLTVHVKNAPMRAHPLRHLVVDAAVASLKPVAAPFGNGPWPCLNPLAEHYRSRVVARCLREPHRLGLRGRFVCDCGYAYSMSVKHDGRLTSPRIRHFGPTLIPHLQMGLRRGDTYAQMAKGLGLGMAVLVNQARRTGIELGQDSCQRQQAPDHVDKSW